MSKSLSSRQRLFGCAAVIWTACSGAALADAAAPPINVSAGTEGADVQAVVVSLEKDTAAAAAPTKASRLPGRSVQSDL